MYLTYSILSTGQTDVGNDREAQSRLVRTCLVCPAYVADRSKSLRPEVHGLLLDVLSLASAGQVHRGLLGDCLGSSTDPFIRSANSRSAPSPEHSRTFGRHQVTRSHTPNSFTSSPISRAKRSGCSWEFEDDRPTNSDEIGFVRRLPDSATQWEEDTWKELEKRSTARVG
jgi:hypothetical protein